MKPDRDGGAGQSAPLTFLLCNDRGDTWIALRPPPVRCAGLEAYNPLPSHSLSHVPVAVIKIKGAVHCSRGDVEVTGAWWIWSHSQDVESSGCLLLAFFFYLLFI